MLEKQVEDQQGTLLALICPHENQKPPFTPDGSRDHDLIEYRCKTEFIRRSFSKLGNCALNLFLFLRTGIQKYDCLLQIQPKRDQSKSEKKGVPKQHGLLRSSYVCTV